MRRVVWGQDPAVMGSFITVSQTGTEKPRAEGGWNPNRTIVRDMKRREKIEVGGGLCVISSL